MASLTVTIDRAPLETALLETAPLETALLETALLEAERRRTSLHQMVADCIASVAHVGQHTANSGNRTRLMSEGALGHVDRPMSREDISVTRLTNTHHAA